MDIALGKSAKSLLNELYQKQIRAPRYETTKDSELPGATFTCQVELPAIAGAFVGAKLKGAAKSKKLAEQNAAENALRYIHEVGVMHIRFSLVRAHLIMLDLQHELPL